MTQPGFLHSEMTMAAQPYRQHSETANLNHLSPQFASPVHSLQHENSPLPISHGISESHAETSDVEATPPTSSSGFSSQETPVFVGQDSSISTSNSLNANTLPALKSKSLAESRKNAANFPEHIAASKRTSSGQIKRSSILGTDTSVDNHQKRSGHSRTSSLLSNGSSITELSQQLRTRLSYAMVKVENGWESNTMEEIAMLTSQHGSPRSSRTATSLGSKGQTLQSPTTALTSSLRRQDSSSASSESVSAPTGGLQVNDRAPGASSNQQRKVKRQQKRALAPPADIVPGSRRRPHHANVPPNGYKSVNSLAPTGTKQRTPSQSAAMEADAVETLLFMASPGNSSHQPSSLRGIASSAQISAPASSQPSPLKPDFPNHEPLASPPRRVAFTDSSDTTPIPASISPQFEDIDRMIDEMDDTSTDSGLEYIRDPTALQPGGDHVVPT